MLLSSGALSSRELDVLISGPLYLFASQWVKNRVLKTFVLAVGFGTIIYNLHNYLYIDARILKHSLLPSSLVNPRWGKTQLHRLYNICIMYPILFYIYKNISVPVYLHLILYTQLGVGFIYNLINYLKLSKLAFWYDAQFI